MRVLWFTNKPSARLSECLGRSLGVGGGWLDALEEQLREVPGLTLGLAADSAEEHSPVEVGNTTYFDVGLHRRRTVFRRGLSLGGWCQAEQRQLRRSIEVVEEYRPDVIHVHGTEGPWGLLSELVEIPLVVSLQGIPSVYCRKELHGLDKHLLLCMSLSQAARGYGFWSDHVDMRRRAAREREILAASCHFIGRTRFDEAFVRVLNPRANYYHCDELMRRDFYHSTWDVSANCDNRVFSASTDYLRKGLPSLLEAVSLLRNGPIPNLTLSVAGGIAPDRRRAASRLARTLGVEHAVTYLGALDARGMVEELMKARVFVHPSLADNSPNAVAEAMLVGTPVVATSVGGIPSMIRPEVDGLLVQESEPFSLAGAMARVLRDRELAVRLSVNARAVAARRHDAKVITSSMMHIYRLVAGDTQRRAK